jgi:hypothetical protein
MSGYFSVRHTLGYDRFPATEGRGTIPAADARYDDVNDLIGAKLRKLWHARQSAYGWSGECERHRRDVERICSLNGYTGLWADARDYLVHIVGQSLLYDVPAGKRGHLAAFAGKRVRVVCTHSGVFRRFVWIGAVGAAQRRQRPTSSKPADLANARPPLPRLLREEELADTPHLLARFAGHWSGAGGMSRAFHRGLRFQAAVWHARRFYEWTGGWPQGRHEVIARYGPTDDFPIRTPIGTSQGYCEAVLHFDVHPAGAPFVLGNTETGYNWCAFAIDGLEITKPEQRQ